MFRRALPFVLLLAGCHSGGLDVTCHSALCNQNGSPVDLASSHVDLLGGSLADLAMQSGSITLNIPKVGPPFSGAMTDPGLNDPSQCPDASVEPNDDAATALRFTPTPDMPQPKIIKMAICPTGNSPFTGKHDVDVYRIDNSTGPASLTLRAEIFYDISMGDLDVGILDSSLNVLSVDGTAVSNGCAAAAIGQNLFYVVVVGANNIDSNRYEILLESFTTPQTCPTT
jgi:hypothetical protein